MSIQSSAIQGSGAGRPASATPLSSRRIFGVRLLALAEIAAFLAIALSIDAYAGANDRFAGVVPHPFFLVVMLAASYYGTVEGLAAALLASAALLAGHMPQASINEDIYVWALRIMKLPLLWVLTAVMLGQIRDSLRRRQQGLAAELAEAKDQAHTLAAAFEDVRRVRKHLETRIAGQLRTVYAMYQASRAIERKSIGEVLRGVAELVRCVMEPSKFSLFLLNGDVLEAAVSEGWKAGDPYARLFDASSELHQAVVKRREFLVAGDPRQEKVLGGEGMLAGPLVNGANGQIVGMLKVEQIPFLELHPASVQNFHILCDWIGNAFANAQQAEDLAVGGRP